MQEEYIKGLTSDEVAEQKRLGNVNVAKERAGKSYLKIVADNLFTYFNLIWAVITLAIVICGSFGNLTYLFIVIPNILIATLQEIRAKHTVERLKVTTEPRATVIRDGREEVIKVSEILLGDVMKIGMGHQVLSDGEVISGYAEANESLLTGESDAIKKKAGDSVLAGSFIVSGSIFVRVTRVGKDNYVNTIESAAKGYKAPASNLFRDIRNLIKYIGGFIIPLAILMAVKNYFGTDGDVITTVVKTAGAVIGMIPAGIYLLITVTLTLSVMLLAKRRTLVSDMYSIEMLASADVVCLDKTGTITDGTMRVCDFIPLSSDVERIRSAISVIEEAEESQNNTSRALIDYFGKKDALVTDKIPFSSARKYSAVSVEGMGSFAIGAPGFVPCEITPEIDERIKEHASQGHRVLVLAELERIDGEGRALALVAIADNIRPNARETIAQFQDQGVDIKIISGDHAETVSAIAVGVGVKNADNYISCQGLSDAELIEASEGYTVFGRVTPEQKVLLVKALKDAGHIVAMTGDGVNDTLALKESNCAIAMADGSEVARAVSQIVLLDSDFATLPDVVKEGRRCINNVRNSAILFLMKTVFVIGLTLFSICVPGMTYPFEPKQFILLEMLVIGIPSVLLAFEPSYNRIKGSFLKTVLFESLPSAFIMYIPVLIIMILGTVGVNISDECRNSVAMMVVTLVGYCNLISICRPFTKWRAFVVIGSGAAILFAVVASLVGGLFIAEMPRDIIGILPAMENPVFAAIMLIIGLVLALVLGLCRQKIKKAFSTIPERIEEIEKIMS